MTLSPHHLSRLTGSDTPTPQEAGHALLEVIQKEYVNPAEVKLLLAAHADLTMRDCYQRTALYLCSSFGHSKIIPLLLAAGADPCVFDNHGQSIFENATILRYKPCIQALIDGNVDLETRNMRGLTPLLFAAAWGRDEIAELLMKSGADLDATDYSGDDAVTLAKERGHDSLAKRLADFRENEWAKLKLLRYSAKGLPLMQPVSAPKAKPKGPR